ncbi:hypothetical protein O7627_25170 [Solwaraspora sp. WMMD1047]|uniref:hypothetical protein n=1 Tax=Solwaraspora sp. WMMD1047 TaxID=3016102 RepID=UPI002417092C|nr:hypothetical protein [Solwaraspora sp. WMMD1047]MDG4832576.1 hypothetical protein [Solwaraspora sp. WMMD1047]
MTASMAARTIGRAAREAAEAAAGRDPAALERAVEKLAEQRPEQVGLVLGGTLRRLLEQSHPDGLTGDDLRDLVVGCARGAAGWLPELDPGVLAVVLTGALGVQPSPEETGPVDPAALARHGALLIAELAPATGRPVADHLSDALAEIAVDQTMELP